LVGVIGAGYVALTLSYTLVWRHLLLLDIVAIAGGFVLRALAGGAAPPVALSRWFVLVVTAAAVFVAAGKRHGELLRTVAANALVRRRVLEGYTELRLRLILAASGAVAVIAYAGWALMLPDVDGIPWRPLTLIPFAACILRYGVLLRAGQGESPEELLLHDRLLQVGAVVWVVLFALGVHAAS
jgi:decaprenyl-phosphate phosphoribosyltransferase